jgi:hypothetical protein
MWPDHQNIPSGGYVVRSEFGSHVLQQAVTHFIL